MTLFEAVGICGKSILYVNVVSILTVNVIHFTSRPKRLSRSMILLMALLFGTLFIELVSEYLAHRKIPNLHLTHYYTIGQFFVLSVIYYNQLKKFQIVVPIGVALFSSILMYQLIQSKIEYNVFNTAGFLVSACVLITYAFFYYIEHIAEKRYWDTFNVGLFLYLGGSSIIFLTMNNYKDLAEYYMDIWTINGMLVVLYQLFISITIYRYYRIQKSQNGYSSL
jgi:hypothetical protein